MHTQSDRQTEQQLPGWNKEPNGLWSDQPESTRRPKFPRNHTQAHHNQRPQSEPLTGRIEPAENGAQHRLSGASTGRRVPLLGQRLRRVSRSDAVPQEAVQLLFHRPVLRLVLRGVRGRLHRQRHRVQPVSVQSGGWDGGECLLKSSSATDNFYKVFCSVACNIFFINILKDLQLDSDKKP